MRTTQRITPTADSIKTELRNLAPSVVFSVRLDRDDSFQWDGDGPDPRSEGFECYDVTVKARTIVHGLILEGHDSLGGHYDKPGEHDADISGYLPQMLEEAAEDLVKQLRTNCPEQTVTLNQLDAARVYLGEVMRARYAEQMATR